MFCLANKKIPLCHFIDTIMTLCYTLERTSSSQYRYADTSVRIKWYREMGGVKGFSPPSFYLVIINTLEQFICIKKELTRFVKLFLHFVFYFLT